MNISKMRNSIYSYVVNLFADITYWWENPTIKDEYWDEYLISKYESGEGFDFSNQKPFNDMEVKMATSFVKPKLSNLRHAMKKS